MLAYNLPERILHYLALRLAPVAELSFDIDQWMVGSDPEKIVDERHVFVSGLARAGTTALMRRFYATGAYGSLTYRDMPFVLAPNLWRTVAGRSRPAGPATMRAHGDGILVNVDSPESLDEVFWRIFAGPDYIGETALEPHSPDADTAWKYVCYINAILAAQQRQTRRYLCKNNNNILRLRAIRDLFPQALILIPFRSPLAQASSLLRQHRNFKRMQAEDSFVRSYMTWLVHHEFGEDHRPFRVGQEDTDLRASRSADSLEYWLRLWCSTYGWLEESAPDDALFVCYEDLCSTVETWKSLAELAGVAAVANNGDLFRESNASTEATYDSELLEQASTVYDRLALRSHTTLQSAVR